MPSITTLQSAIVILFIAKSEALFTEFATVNFLTLENRMEMNS